MAFSLLDKIKKLKRKTWQELAKTYPCELFSLIILSQI